MTSVAADADGWQRPIGLIPSEAICIDDSDEERQSTSSANNNPTRVFGLKEGPKTKPVQAWGTKPPMEDALHGFQQSNPFARFAFQPNEPNQSNQSTLSSFNESKNDQRADLSHPTKKAKWSIKEKSEDNTKQDEPDQIEECISKWHAFSVPTDTIETRRFQVLVAARLHVRCQENTVRKAMDRLRNHFESGSGVSQSSNTGEGLTPASLSKAKPED